MDHPVSRKENWSPCFFKVVDGCLACSSWQHSSRKKITLFWRLSFALFLTLPHPSQSTVGKFLKLVTTKKEFTLFVLGIWGFSNCSVKTMDLKIESKIKNLKKLKIVQRAALWYRGAFWQSQKSLTLNGAQWSGLVEMNQIGRVAAAVHFFFYEKREGVGNSVSALIFCYPRSDCCNCNIKFQTFEM